MGLLKVVVMDSCPAVVDVNLLLSGISWTQILDYLRQMLGCSFRASWKGKFGAPCSPGGPWEPEGNTWTSLDRGLNKWLLLCFDVGLPQGRCRGLIPEQQLDLYLTVALTHSRFPHLLLLDSVSG